MSVKGLSYKKRKTYFEIWKIKWQDKGGATAIHRLQAKPVTSIVIAVVQNHQKHPCEGATKPAILWKYWELRFWRGAKDLISCGHDEGIMLMLKSTLPF